MIEHGAPLTRKSRIRWGGGPDNLNLGGGNTGRMEILSSSSGEFDLSSSAPPFDDDPANPNGVDPIGDSNRF